MGWFRRSREVLFPSDLQEALTTLQFARIARIRAVVIPILLALNVLLRFQVARHAPQWLGTFDRFLWFVLAPAVPVYAMNLAALALSTRMTPRAWRVVTAISIPAEVWWACCAAWIDGASGRPMPHIVLLILAYRMALDGRVGLWILTSAVAFHGGLIAVEHFHWVPLNPLGVASGPSRDGAPMVSVRFFWVPVTYVLAWLIAQYAMLGLRRTESALRSTNEALRDALAEVSRLARVDPLTKVWNRRYLEEQLDRELSRAQRFHHVVSVLMIDFDHFKDVNDRHGHRAGDETLVRFAELLRRQLRKTDVVARYGGEEFIVVLPETSREAALAIAERIREAQRDDGLHTTVSIGVADSTSAGTDVAKVVGAADDALYCAKNAGRNRVLAAPTTSN